MGLMAIFYWLLCLINPTTPPLLVWLLLYSGGAAFYFPTIRNWCSQFDSYGCDTCPLQYSRYLNRCRQSISAFSCFCWYCYTVVLTTGAQLHRIKLIVNKIELLNISFSNLIRRIYLGIMCVAKWSPGLPWHIFSWWFVFSMTQLRFKVVYMPINITSLALELLLC